MRLVAGSGKGGMACQNLKSCSSVRLSPLAAPLHASIDVLGFECLVRCCLYGTLASKDNAQAFETKPRWAARTSLKTACLGESLTVRCYPFAESLALALGCRQTSTRCCLRACLPHSKLLNSDLAHFFLTARDALHRLMQFQGGQNHSYPYSGYRFPWQYDV